MRSQPNAEPRYERLDQPFDPLDVRGEVGEVGNFHIHKSQEFLDDEASFGRRLGASALSAVGIDRLLIIDDHDSYDLAA